MPITYDVYSSLLNKLTTTKGIESTNIFSLKKCETVTYSFAFISGLAVFDNYIILSAMLMLCVYQMVTDADCNLLF